MKSFKTLIAAALVAVGATCASAATTVTANGIGTSFSIGFSQNYTDANNPTPVPLSAQSDWTLTNYSATATTATWSFSVLVQNLTALATVGTNRISTWGFDTTPNSTSANLSPASGWSYSSGNVPGGLGRYDVCATAGSNCSGGGSGGIAEASSVLFNVVINTALANPLSFDNFYVRYQGVGVGSAGSTAFTGAPVSPVPLPAAGLMLLAGLGALAAARRMKHAA